MDAWMNAAMLIEATMLSFLLALWIAWMSLRGLFEMLPGRRLEAAPIRPMLRQVDRAAAGRMA
jgi:hypothetical protein